MKSHEEIGAILLVTQQKIEARIDYVEKGGSLCLEYHSLVAKIKKILCSDQTELQGELDAVREELRALHVSSASVGSERSHLIDIFCKLNEYISATQKKVELVYPLCYKTRKVEYISYGYTPELEGEIEKAKSQLSFLVDTTDNPGKLKQFKAYQKKITALEKIVRTTQVTKQLYKAAYHFFKIIEDIDVQKKLDKKEHKKVTEVELIISSSPKDLPPKVGKKKKYRYKKSMAAGLAPKPVLEKSKIVQKPKGVKGTHKQSTKEIDSDTALHRKSRGEPERVLQPKHEETVLDKLAQEEHAKLTQAVLPEAGQASTESSSSSAMASSRVVPLAKSVTQVPASFVSMFSTFDEQEQPSTANQTVIALDRQIDNSKDSKLKGKKQNTIYLDSLANPKKIGNVQRKLTWIDRRLDAVARLLHKTLNLNYMPAGATAVCILPNETGQAMLMVATRKNLNADLVKKALVNLKDAALTKHRSSTREEVIAYIIGQTNRLKKLKLDLSKPCFKLSEISLSLGAPSAFKKYTFLMQNIRYDIDLAKFFLLITAGSGKHYSPTLSGIFQYKRFMVVNNIVRAHPELALADFIFRNRHIAKMPKQVYIGSHILNCKKCHVLLKGEVQAPPKTRYIAEINAYGSKKEMLGLRQLHHLFGFNEKCNITIYTRGHYEYGYPESFVPDFATIINCPTSLLPPKSTVAFIKGRLNKLSLFPAATASARKLFLEEHAELSDSEEDDSSATPNKHIITHK